MIKRLALKFLTSFGTPASEIVHVPVRSIKVREVSGLDFSKLRQIRTAYEQAKEHELPPIDLMKIGEDYFLFDGQHRLVLRALHGHTSIKSTILYRKAHHQVDCYTQNVKHLLNHL